MATGLFPMTRANRLSDWHVVRPFNISTFLTDMEQEEAGPAVAARGIALNDIQRLRFWSNLNLCPWTVYLALHDRFGRRPNGVLRHQPKLKPFRYKRQIFVPNTLAPYLEATGLPKDRPLVSESERDALLAAASHKKTGPGVAVAKIKKGHAGHDGHTGVVMHAGAPVGSTPSDKMAVAREAKKILKELNARHARHAAHAPANGALDDPSQAVEFSFNVKQPMSIKLILGRVQ